MRTKFECGHHIETEILVSPELGQRMTHFIESQLAGYRLTTAEITYHMPDHPGLLQEYIWQDLDIAPKYPQLHRFLDFWESKLDGRIHSVRVASAALVSPAEFRHADGLIRMH